MPGSANYANITPVPENAESPSPGYQSGGSPSQEQSQNEHFLFKVWILIYHFLHCKTLVIIVYLNVMCLERNYLTSIGCTCNYHYRTNFKIFLDRDFNN